MTLNEFRASRRYLPIEQARAEYPHIADMDFGPEYTNAMIYADGYYTVQSRRGFYLILERDEYESRDLPLLEWLLWQWSQESSPEIDAIRASIWG